MDAGTRVLIPDSKNAQMFSLPFSSLHFVPTQKIENNLVLLLNAKHVKEMMLLPSEMEPVYAIASSVDQVRFVKTANVSNPRKLSLIPLTNPVWLMIQIWWSFWIQMVELKSSMVVITQSELTRHSKMVQLHLAHSLALKSSAKMTRTPFTQALLPKVSSLQTQIRE